MTTRSLVRGGLGLVLVAVIGVPAVAQSQEPRRGYIVGLGGLASTEVNAPFFGGSAGFNLTHTLIVTVDTGRMQDVLPHFTRQDLALLDHTLGSAGIPSSSTTKVPVNTFSGGVRYILPSTHAIRPYLSGGVGLAHMSPKPTFTALGIDITREVMSDSERASYFREETRPMATVGGGVNLVAARHLTVDIGYKYSGIFITTDYLQDLEGSPHSHTRIDTHRVYAGAGFVF